MKKTDKYNQVINLRAKGVSQADIVKITGLNRNTVSKYINIHLMEVLKPKHYNILGSKKEPLSNNEMDYGTIDFDNRYNYDEVKEELKKEI